MDLDVDAAAWADLESGVAHEWIVTDGLGGYASGTLAGIATRAYHGLLVSARTPPVGRAVVVGGLDEVVSFGRERIALHAHERADGSVEGEGYRRLASFGLDHGLPVWRYDLGGARLERRVFMADGFNTTFVRYELEAPAGPGIELELTPLITQRDHHAVGRPTPGTVDFERLDDGLSWSWDGGRRTRLIAAGATIAPDGRWRPAGYHREEAARGEEDVSELIAACLVRVHLEPGRPWTLVLTDDPAVDPDAERALAGEFARRDALLTKAQVEDAPPAIRQLVFAADQFLVRRSIPDPAGGPPTDGRSVIAGYPWFNDWGRDTMIALAGLTLATGRHDEGATILRSFAQFVRDGLLPNNFPDRSDDVPAYHTVDASLWFAVAIHRHLTATGDRALVDELLPTLRTILDAHVAGTRFGIAMDDSDGLLRSGEDGVQLTWMDALVDGWVVTPRRGKPVEIQALWVNALRIVGDWLVERGDRDGTGTEYRAIAERATASFARRFWQPDLGRLLDVVDGPDGDDAALRPNQLFAISLAHPLVAGDIAERVVAACRDELATPFGLRSLAPSDPAYRRSFQGDRLTRDAAYHQGTVWSWLLGPYAEAVARVTGDRAAGIAVLRPILAHLCDAGLGSISEIFEPEPPFEPRGCVAQAWSVAEVLRVWRSLGE